MGRRDLVQRGREGEAWAAHALRAAGYRILARRWAKHSGEIDIIALDADGFAFVEVKTRRGRAFGYPEEAVSDRKLARLRRTAEEWLAKKVGNKSVDWRIDVVAVEMGRKQIPWRITIFRYFEL